MTLSARYTKVAILLHWIVTVLILANFALILAWENVGEDQEARVAVICRICHRRVAVNQTRSAAPCRCVKPKHRPQGA